MGRPLLLTLLLYVSLPWLPLDWATLCLMFAERHGEEWYGKGDDGKYLAWKDCSYRVKYPEEKRRIEEMFR